MPDSDIADNFFLVGERQSPRDTAETGREFAAASLVGRIKQREAGAFQEFYERYSGFVHAIVLAKVPREDSEDIAQEVFLAAFRSIGTLRDENSLGPWIARIARNKSVEYHRRKKPAGELDSEAVEPYVPKNEANEALDAILALPETYRETLLMRLVEGLTGPEIVKLTGRKEASVRVNIHRGMKLLRKKLGIAGK